LDNSFYFLFLYLFNKKLNCFLIIKIKTIILRTLLKLSAFKFNKPFKMTTNSSISFYIPRMLAGTREEDVKNAFEEAKIGNVYRIDFTPLGKKPGFVENLTGTHKSAFVHFTSVFEGHHINTLVRDGQEYKLFPYRNSDEYWLLKPARSIMQDTMMNNAQIVSNCRALESKMAEQAAKIDEQSATIDTLKQDLKGLQDVVQHLVRGLYCQERQSQCINAHMWSMFECDKPYQIGRFENPDTHQWDSWPTTRQGDDSERRIESLERQFKELTEFNPSLLESENQSLPSLVYSVSSCREEQIPPQKPLDQLERIEKIQEKLDGVHQVVYQLVGGLYCQNEQSNSIDRHLNHLFPNLKEAIISENTSKWTIWPTTRQGDECERRLEALENQLKQPEEPEEAEIQFVPITLRKALVYDELFEVEDSDSDLSSLTEK